MPKVKMDRAAEEFRRVLSQVITTEIRDDRVTGKCSVMEVEVTPDFQYAKVYVSIMGDEKDKQKGLDALLRAKGFLKKRLSEIVQARKIPELQFVLDTSLDYSMHIDQLLNEIKGE